MPNIVLAVRKMTTRRKREVARVDEVRMLVDKALRELDAEVAEFGSKWRETGECEIRIEVIQTLATLNEPKCDAYCDPQTGRHSHDC